MLADRQTEDGKLPMGYLEHSDGYNVADGGQITLAIAQSLPYITDYARKEKYQETLFTIPQLGRKRFI